MTIQDAYNLWAATYDTDRNLTRDLDGRVTREVLAAIHDARILELGCGTGKNTIFLAQIATRLRAMDFSEAMLAKAWMKITASHVTFTVADLTQPWPCESASVDLVVGNLVLEHIEGLPFIFAEAGRCLAPSGRCFISELHPFRQYLGAKATFERSQGATEIPAFVHHISDFLDAAAEAGLRLVSLKEWWHEEDEQTPPRLVSFLFEKA